MPTGNLLIVDDNKNALYALKMFLNEEFENITTISNPNQIHSLIRSDDYDIVLLDMNFSAGVSTGNEGLYWLKEIKKISPLTEVVMITAYGDVELAVKALKKGAADFITKPWQNEKLLATLKSAYKLRISNLELNDLKKRETSLKKAYNPEEKIIIGSSPKMIKLMDTVAKVAKTDANVLITGENGTGKGVIAAEIHNQSARNNELLVTVDMGSVPPTLFESELFGHKKGAFTDAKEDRIGKFQLADKGTLFLDEIGNLPLDLQSKLLAALQNRKITPIGSNKEISVDIRLISATNCDIDSFVAEQKFREDLLYRLNTIEINIPPLRERKEDIELLISLFLKQFETKYHKPDLKISSQAIKKLTKYHWPGNIRELCHTIEKAVILSDSDILKPDDFMFKPASKSSTEVPRTIEQMEKLMIENVLNKFDGNQSLAANELGITRQTLYNKIKKYDL